jgi:hypothetical protein
MKQSVPTGVVVAIIVVVVAVVGYFGFKALGTSHAKGPDPAEMSKRMKENPGAMNPTSTGGMRGNTGMMSGGSGMTSGGTGAGAHQSGGMMSGGR